jgi:hypothetical protein
MSITCTWFLALLVRHPSCSQRSHLKPDSLTLAMPQERVFRTKQSPRPSLPAKSSGPILGVYHRFLFRR